VRIFNAVELERDEVAERQNEAGEFISKELGWTE